MIAKILTICIPIAIVIILLILILRIVPQANAYVIERLGKYHTTWEAGLHGKIPFIDKVSRRVPLKEQVADFAPQPVITKDNVTMRIDSVVFFQVIDPKLFAYGVDSPLTAIENLTSTTLRNVIGEMELDETLTSRETINAKMQTTINVATAAWGIRINRVELKNITPPAAIQDAMEKQMKAEREKREAILIAEGEKESSIRVAEGKKRSAILLAEGEKESTILKAEAEREAMILRADAAREASIREAEGHGEAIRLVQEANAEGIEFLNQKSPSPEVLQLKSLEAFAKAADGKASKLIIIPEEIKGISGLAASVAEIAERRICDGTEPREALD